MKLRNIFLALVIGVLCSLPAFAEFSDVDDEHPNAKAIGYVESEGIVNGYPDGTYKPDALLNRAEFTKIIIAATYSQEKIDACTGLDFPDVPVSEWFAPYVCIAQSEEVVGGYPDGTFQPTNTINFVEAAKIIVNAFGHQAEVYPDVWFQGYVEVLGKLGSIPMSIDSFEHALTRGEMAEMIMRLKTETTDEPSQTYASLSGEEPQGEENEEEGDDDEEMTLEKEVDMMADEEFDKMEDEDQEGETLKKGEFVSGGYETTGMAFLKQTNAGYMLRFEDFMTTNGPDLRVYLSASAENVDDAVELGKLGAPAGDMNYEVSGDVDFDTYTHVLIWCEPYSVLFGVASFEEEEVNEEEEEVLEATVTIPQGVNIPGCEETDECYLPAAITVKVGTTVTWENTDNSAHTVTSGTADDGPSGVFDSSLMMAGTSFEYTFTETGTYPYYCMVHPWMEGEVVVEE